MYRYAESGIASIWLVNGYRKIRTSEGTGVSIEDVDGLHRVIARYLVHHKPRLAGKEFRFLRIELDMSQAKLAQMLGTTDQAVARWERGRSRVPKMAERFLRAIYREIAEGNAHITKMVDRLNQLDVTAWRDRRFERAGNRWRAAA